MKGTDTTIGIVGAGNIGLELAAELTYRGKDVLLYTKRNIPCEISVKDDRNGDYSIAVDRTDSIDVICNRCRVIIVTYPPSIFKRFNRMIEHRLRPGTILILMPGTGGSEYVFKELLNDGCILIGMQRVPGVYRYNRKNNVATISGRRAEGLKVSSIPKMDRDELADMIRDIFLMDVKIMPNYLNITLTPSNPILHTSRLYALFKGGDHDTVFDRNPLFYGDWDDESSDILIRCDTELFSILNDLKGLDTSGIRSLLDHYECDGIESMTKKISSIASLKHIPSPMIETNEGYVIDWSSRYFTSDFPDGLMIIKSIGLITSTPTPQIDEIIMWYQSMIGKEYIKSGRELGKDSIECNIPQNNGIFTKEDLIRFYEQRC